MIIFRCTSLIHSTTKTFLEDLHGKFFNREEDGDKGTEAQRKMKDGEPTEDING